MAWTRRAFLGRAAAAAAVPAAVVAAAKIGEAASASRKTARGGAAARTPAVHHPTVAENSLPGDPHWYLTNLGAPDAVQGYTGQASVLPGEPIHLYVSTTAREFRATAFRMGWYRGDLARQVWQSAMLRGHRQGPSRVSEDTR